jgi:hypothetical protein
MRLPTHALRRAAIEKLDSDLHERATLRNFDSRGKRDIESSQAFAAVIAAIMLPPAARVRESEDVLRQTSTNIDVALALCEFRNDENRYPEQLEQLVPEYLAKMPVDRFTGAKPIYRRTEAGYLLYSVGPNMKDEDGRKDGNADDIAVTL